MVRGNGAFQVPHREHKGTTSPHLADHPRKLLLSPCARQPGKTPGVRSRWFTTEKTKDWSWKRFSKGKMRRKVQKEKLLSPGSCCELLLFAASRWQGVDLLQFAITKAFGRES